MNTIKTKEQAKVMLDAAHGAVIEMQPRTPDALFWSETNDPKWNWPACVYRVKKESPEPVDLNSMAYNITGVIIDAFVNEVGQPPFFNENKTAMQLSVEQNRGLYAYMTNPQYHRKVDSVVYAVMNEVRKHGVQEPNQLIDSQKKELEEVLTQSRTMLFQLSILLCGFGGSKKLKTLINRIAIIRDELT